MFIQKSPNDENEDAPTKFVSSFMEELKLKTVQNAPEVTGFFQPNPMMMKTGSFQIHHHAQLRELS